MPGRSFVAAQLRGVPLVTQANENTSTRPSPAMSSTAGGTGFIEIPSGAGGLDSETVQSDQRIEQPGTAPIEDRAAMEQ